MTLDDREKCDGRDRLGLGKTLLLDAADSSFAYHGSSADKIGKALLAQAREKLPDPEIGTGGELIQPREASTYLYNTLDYPDLIAADASAQRMHLAKDAGALALGVDTADTIQAANSAEQMLAHQIAAAHAGAMRLMGQLTNMTLMQATALRTDDSANLRITRLAGAASRLMLAFQQGLLTLDRLRGGGTQNIVVQHVQVNGGGRAVVAGKVRGGKGGSGNAAVSGSARAVRKNSRARGRGQK
jgi:hypothetical protein